jgi:hypothetical protein
MFINLCYICHIIRHFKNKLHTCFSLRRPPWTCCMSENLKRLEYKTRFSKSYTFLHRYPFLNWYFYCTQGNQITRDYLMISGLTSFQINKLTRESQRPNLPYKKALLGAFRGFIQRHLSLPFLSPHILAVMLLNTFTFHVVHHLR